MFIHTNFSHAIGSGLSFPRTVPGGKAEVPETQSSSRGTEHSQTTPTGTNPQTSSQCLSSTGIYQLEGLQLCFHHFK